MKVKKFIIKRNEKIENWALCPLSYAGQPPTHLKKLKIEKMKKKKK